MEVIYHPQVRVDAEEALSYYRKISAGLADEFYFELRSLIAQVAETPQRFHFADRGFRRANLNRFPYHVLYEIFPESVRVMLLRHNKRHPDYGLPRE